MYRVLFVCLGNICRSPTAEGVFRQLVRQAGLENKIETDSAGTAGYHIGEAPDRRSQKHAKARGVDISDLRGQQIDSSHFVKFDLVLAMDNSNMRDLESVAPQDQLHKLQLFLRYARKFKQEEVPDPYYGGAEGFEHVLDLVQDASEGLLEFIKTRLEASDS